MPSSSPTHHNRTNSHTSFVSPSHNSNQHTSGGSSGYHDDDEEHDESNGYHQPSFTKLRPLKPIDGWDEDKIRKALSAHQTARLNDPDCFPLASLINANLDVVIDALLVAKGYPRLDNGAWRNLSNEDLEWHILDILGS